MHGMVKCQQSASIAFITVRGILLLMHRIWRKNLYKLLKEVLWQLWVQMGRPFKQIPISVSLHTAIIYSEMFT